MDEFHFTKNKKNQFVPLPQDCFRNNLLFIVGFLELANALDFPANVWNQIPVPTHAAVLMAIGGIGAAILTTFAFFDARLAWFNLQFLRRHRRLLKLKLEQQQQLTEVEVLLTLTKRELGSELINRFGMDVFMGFGGLVICVGTFMAIGGANYDVFIASNQLTGYVGNAPIALYGIVNFTWSSYLAVKAQQHACSAARSISGTEVMTLVHRRCRLLQAYFVTNGTMTLLGGAASLMTATKEYAYYILAPVVISSPICNLLWQRWIGYTRDFNRAEDFSTESLVASVQLSCSILQDLENDRFNFIAPGEPTPWPALLSFMQQYGMMEDFCIRLLEDPTLSILFCGSLSTEVSLSLSTLQNAPMQTHDDLAQLAKAHIHQAGRLHVIYFQRFQIELLMVHLHHLHMKDTNAEEKVV